ncbi:MAG: hypothetical protein QXZ13_02350 [Candidatus Diapherotrites archaeon]
MRKKKLLVCLVILAIAIIPLTLGVTYEVVEGPPIATCGNSTCDQGESCINCPQDCGQCQTSPENQGSPTQNTGSSSGTTSGNSAVSSGTTSVEEKPIIKQIQVDLNQEQKTANITIQIYNGLTRAQAFSVSATIKSDTKTIYSTTETTTFLGAKKTLNYKLKKEWKFEPGEYTIIIYLDSKEKTTNYDTITKILALEEGKIEIRDSPQQITTKPSIQKTQSQEPEETITPVSAQSPKEAGIDLTYIVLWGLISGIFFVGILIFVIQKFYNK